MKIYFSVSVRSYHSLKSLVLRGLRFSNKGLGVFIGKSQILHTSFFMIMAGVMM